eukprot:TRINITY_DN3563_c0_g1_i10.p1 TRINITY_DN3563_c0_g1~~TRINITY_DN3563_c0_g1_i10.p1  ORF type:complete len:524 (-),score=118.15 TRINITY_DN3563_c0_g1_i10:267-1838(-)
MLSLTTEARLADLIGAIADNERQLEARRQDLVRDPLFSPYAAFYFLDRAKTGYLTAFDIRSFLKDNAVPITLEEADKLVEVHGDRLRQKLYKGDFVDMVLPYDPVLRAESLRRSEYEPLTRTSELFLAKLLQSIVDGNSRLEVQRRTLTLRYDYNVFDAFRAIDRYRSGYITPTSLSAFLKAAGYLARLDDAELFIKALDRDKDGRLSYSEFIDGLVPCTKKQESLFYSEKKPSYYRSHFESPTRLRTEYKPRVNRFDSTERHRSIIDYESPVRRRYDSIHKSTYKLSESYISPYKSTYSAYPKEDFAMSRRLDYYSPSKQEQLGKELALIMEEQLAYEKRFERTKEDLVLQPDFNLMNGFRLFDRQGKGYATAAEFSDGLKELGVASSYAEASLLFNRMDSDHDGRVKYSDYCFVFSPKRPEYEKVVIEKPPYDKNYLIERYVYFSAKTKMIYRDAFEVLLDHERALEKIRGRLKYFDIRQAFEVLDSQGKGQVSMKAVNESITNSCSGFWSCTTFTWEKWN